MAKKDEIDTDRRKTIRNIIRGTGLMAFGGIAWGGVVNENKAAELILRPPGALSEDEFLKACIKCGLCVENCPYDTLKLAEPGDNLPVGTPYFKPRDIPCYMCTDIPCVPACPSGALKEENVTSPIEEGSEKTKLDINKAQMGLAVIDTENCLAYWGIRCDACYRACPLMGEAMTIEFVRNERTGKHAMLKPKVHSDICTGCGMCEHACITEKAAIFILPRDKALGAVKDDYIRDWVEKDIERVDTSGVYEDINEVEQSTLDYLNAGENLFDE